MNNDYHPISFKRHGEFSIDSKVTFEHVNDVNNLEVVMHEFAKAANEFPIVFIKNVDSGQFQSVILTGIDLGENFFVDDIKWRAIFTPKSASLYPFKLSLTKEENNEKQYGFFIDESCPRLNAGAGERFFDAQGKESKYLESYRLTMSDYFKQNLMTKEFIHYLVDNELLTEGKISLNIPNRKILLDGIYTVNQATLDKLSDEQFLELRKKGYLSVIYAHMNSMHQIDKLAKLKVHSTT
ncbi:MAG: hypothetical protein ACI9N3_003027 [Colwellia sp.]|jgi:hypothetical protein